MKSDLYYREQCQFSNELMLEALHLQFAIFANKHGVTFTDAMLMLQNSFEPVRGGRAAIGGAS